MAERPSQNLANHARFDPPYHFFILPVFAITFVISIVMLVRNPGWLSGWKVVAAAALLGLAFKSRLYALRVQDRIIRLEERLRLATLAPEARAEIALLNEGQLIGLRFACDQEAPALAQRAHSERMSRADIKKAVLNWRPDYWRV
jgi:hypothetical protein